MTTLAFSQTIRFRENLRNGESLLEKAGKLLARINSALLDVAYRGAVEKEVDRQFDKVMCSINDQLKKAEDGSLKAFEEIKALNAAIVSLINENKAHPGERLSEIAPFCSVLITATTLVLTQIRSSRKNLVASGINRAPVGECVDILLRLENISTDVCALLEEISMNSKIHDALLEPPLTKSRNPELNSLLG